MEAGFNSGRGIGQGQAFGYLSNFNEELSKIL